MFDRQILALPGAKRALAFCAAASLIAAALVTVQAMSLASAIVDVWEGGTFAAQLPAVLAFAACFVGRAGVRAWQEASMEAFAHRSVSRLRADVAERLIDSGGAMPNAFGSAAVVTSLIDGCAKAERYLAGTLPRTVGAVVIPVALCAAVLAQDALSGAIVAVCYPFIIAFMRLIGYTASDEAAKRHDGFVEMSSHFTDALRGMATLRAFGLSAPYAQSVHAASERYRAMVMRTLRTAQLSGAVLDVFATCGLAAVAIMLGFRMVEGTIAFLPALIVLMLVPEYFMPIKAYAADYHASLDGKSALAKMLRMRACERRAVRLACPPLDVREGERVALVGASGAGKSSVLDALAGAADIAEGSLRACGVEGARMGERAWRRRVAYIPQHPYILAGTLRENVALYAPGADDARVRDALGKVGLLGLADSLPSGIGTPIGPGGRALSGGEAHRVALARALVGERDVWLLDEPGSSLDEETELELKRAILPLMEGRTVVIATHRSHWAGDVDRVVAIGGEGEAAHGAPCR